MGEVGGQVAKHSREEFISSSIQYVCAGSIAHSKLIHSMNKNSNTR